MSKRGLSWKQTVKTETCLLLLKFLILCNIDIVYTKSKLAVVSHAQSK